MIQRLANRIPITDAMQFVVEFVPPATVRIQVPLDANRNDKQTAFAGSIYSALVLAPWHLLDHLVTRVHPRAKIVVYEAVVNYYKPITTNFVTRVSLPDPAELLAALAHKPTHKLSLTAAAWSPRRERLAPLQGKYFIARDP